MNDLKEKFQTAFSFHKEGNLDEAERLYTEILEEDENNAEIWNLLGMINLQKFRLSRAEEYIKKAGAVGLSYIKVGADMTFKSSIDKFLNEELRNELIEKCGLKEGSTLYGRSILAGKYNASPETIRSAIKLLEDIRPKFEHKEILSKLIFDCYIKRPLQEMEKRVLQDKKISGIYKITYIPTGEAYIGRSQDIKNRWVEHVKSSLNIGTIAHSTFHNVLAQNGLENFTWEVLETAPKEKLNEAEKYWINFYETNKYGYNQKAGG